MWTIRISLVAVQWLALTGNVNGYTHSLLISSFKTPHLFALSFDDETNNFQFERTIFGHGGAPFMAVNREKRMLYAAERDGWSSYRIHGPTSIEFTNYVQLPPSCNNAAVKHGDTVLQIAKNPPFSLYGAGRSPCGVVVGTRPDGGLDRVVQNITYLAQSRVQGMAMDPSGRYLYSADGRDNGLWVHRIDPSTGRLDRGEALDFPMNDAKPRRIAVHPNGRFLYVLLQKLSRVAVFEILMPSSNSGKPTVRFTNLTIALIPSSKSIVMTNNAFTMLTFSVRCRRKQIQSHRSPHFRRWTSLIRHSSVSGEK
jgi:carboxy-cis,cis-muconate cyclase